MPRVPNFIKRIFHALGPILVTCIFAGAIWLLYRQISKYSLADIRASLEQIPTLGVLLSLGLMVINYAILVGYDWLALKGIHKTLPLSKVSLVSFVGQAISYNFGALLGGTTVRYRFYSAWGFSPLDIVRLILMLAVTFWVGALGLVGAIFAVAPPDIPPELGVHIGIGIRPLGILLFLIALSYLVVCWFVHKPVHIFGKEFSFPPFKIAVAQAAVAGADLICAGACLYVLLPPDANVSFIQFLPSYLMGMVLVVLSHVPGGVGVLEVVILHLSTAEPKGVFAALICFRAIYYLIPLIAAAIIFALYELHCQTQKASGKLYGAGRWMRAYAPSLLSGVAFLCGMVLCFQAAIPALSSLPAWLKSFESPLMMEIFYILSALCGTGLLFLAPGIQHRKLAAFRLAESALLTGSVCALLGAFQWPAALLCLALAACLFPFRRSFTRTSTLWNLHASTTWTLSAFAVLGACAALGLVIHHSNPSWASLWLPADYTADAPRMLRILAAEAAAVLLLVLGYVKTIPLRRLRRLAQRSASAKNALTAKARTEK